MDRLHVFALGGEESCRAAIVECSSIVSALGQIFTLYTTLAIYLSLDRPRLELAAMTSRARTA